jgi:chemotaxis protein methyltransferase CheR
MRAREGNSTEEVAVMGLVDDLWSTHGLDYRGWSVHIVAARARQRAALEGLPDLLALRARVLDDRSCLERLVTDLAAHPVGPFADVGFARALRGELSARLRTYPSIRIWHAGCATGEDVYTTAIVLREEGLLARCRIYGTEAGEFLVKQAQAGMSETAWPAACQRYVEAGGQSSLAEYYRFDNGRMMARDDLRARIFFGVHSFASDASFNEFHLVVCRGVLSQFGSSLRARAIQVIDDSLCRFGYLALGPGETTVAPLPRDRFELVRWADDIARKVV